MFWPSSPCLQQAGAQADNLFLPLPFQVFYSCNLLFIILCVCLLFRVIRVCFSFAVCRFTFVFCLLPFAFLYRDNLFQFKAEMFRFSSLFSFL